MAPTNNRAIWTEEEDEKLLDLIENCDITEDKYLAIIFGRTKGAIKSRRDYLMKLTNPEEKEEEEDTDWENDTLDGREETKQKDRLLQIMSERVDNLKACLEAEIKHSECQQKLIEYYANKCKKTWMRTITENVLYGFAVFGGYSVLMLQTHMCYANGLPYLGG